MCQICSCGFYLFLVTSEMTSLHFSVLFDFFLPYSSLGCGVFFTLFLDHFKDSSFCVIAISIDLFWDSCLLFYFKFTAEIILAEEVIIRLFLLFMTEFEFEKK